MNERKLAELAKKMLRGTIDEISRADAYERLVAEHGYIENGLSASERLLRLIRSAHIDITWPDDTKQPPDMSHNRGVCDICAAIIPTNDKPQPTYPRQLRPIEVSSIREPGVTLLCQQSPTPGLWITPSVTDGEYDGGWDVIHRTGQALGQYVSLYGAYRAAEMLGDIGIDWARITPDSDWRIYVDRWIAATSTRYQP